MRILRIMIYVQCMMYKFKTQLINFSMYDFIRDWFIRLYLPLLHQLTIKIITNYDLESGILKSGSLPLVQHLETSSELCCLSIV